MKEDTPSITAFLQQEQIDAIKALPPGGIRNMGSMFSLGEDVVLWMQGPASVLGVDAMVVGIGYQHLEQYDRFVYAVAIPARAEGIYMVVQGLTGHLSKAGTQTPEHTYRSWPEEIINDTRPKPKGSHLKRVK